MAKFNGEVPYDLIKVLDELSQGEMPKEMVKEAGKVVYQNVKSNMARSFKSTKSLDKGLKLTKVYKTGDGGINIHIGFYGYADSKKPVKVTTTNRKTGKSYSYMRSGVPIPLIAMAREYGTSSGEQRKPFLRKSFKKAEIEQIMKKVQDKYIKGD